MQLSEVVVRRTRKECIDQRLDILVGNEHMGRLAVLSPVPRLDTMLHLHHPAPPYVCDAQPPFPSGQCTVSDLSPRMVSRTSSQPSVTVQGPTGLLITRFALSIPSRIIMAANFCSASLERAECASPGSRPAARSLSLTIFGKSASAALLPLVTS